MRIHLAAALGLVVSGVLWANGPAQPPATPGDPKHTEPAPLPPSPPSPAPGDKGPATSPPAGAAAEAIKHMPPSQKLGLRAAFVRSKMPVNPIVVIVPDARSYVAAIGAWRFDAGVRFPVLIDDGSWPAQQAIARFVRAFGPKTVVRWLAPEGVPAWPAETEGRRARLERAAARPWLTGEVPAEGPLADALKAQWAKMQFVPPGIIVASPDDPAWPAALALAAGRGQPVAWLSGHGKADGYMSPADAADLERRIEGAAGATGRSWSGLGDDLDAVTLCLNCATKVFMGEQEQNTMLALTDWIGRKAGDGPEGRPSKERWAWAGQVFGPEWRSAYAAMCSLFLATDTAWLFDGYDPSPPWSPFDATQAAVVLEQLQIKCTVDDNADRSISAWRRRAAGAMGGVGGATSGMGVDAGLVMVNSSGNPDFFSLKPGEGKPSDAPILRRPAIVHFVHSWSAANPTDVNTVAGAWIERGAYAYVGSVHEPYLQAFVATPKLAMRLAAGLPLGAAARLDDGEVWKVNILGDPLITLGRAGTVVNTEMQLSGTIDLQQDLSAAIKGDGPRDYRRALTDLLLMGRDKDGAELLAAVLSQDRAQLTPDAALAGLTSAYLAGDLATFVAAYNVAQPRLASEASVAADGLWDARDMLWHALWPTLGTLSRNRAQLLSLNLRAGTLVRDATEAYGAIAGAVNKGAAHDAVARALRMAKTDAQRRQIEQIEK